jgi:hypothetical protein
MTDPTDRDRIARLWHDLVVDLPPRLIEAGGEQGDLERMREELHAACGDVAGELTELGAAAIERGDERTAGLVLVVSGCVAALARGIDVADDILRDTEAQLEGEGPSTLH